MLAAVIFPAIYHSSFGNFPTEFETPFELGHNATLVIIINIVIFGFGFIYYKNKFPLINTKIDQIRTFYESFHARIENSFIKNHISNYIDYRINVACGSNFSWFVSFYICRL